MKNWKVIKSLFALVFVLSITGCQKEDEFNVVNVQFVSNQPLRVNNNPEFHVQLYGFDPGIQDADATLVAEESFSFKGTPNVIQLKVPDNAVDLVQFVGDKNDVQFYLGVLWDANHNGKVDLGDIFVDRDRALPRIFIETTELQRVFLRQ